MCSRKCGNGVRRIVVLSVLLVLLAGSLFAAWPWAWGSKEAEPVPPQVVMTEAPIPTGMMLLEESLWNELKAQLSAREKALADLKKSYETELSKLRSEIATLTALSTISTELHNGLIVQLEEKTAEAQEYQRQASEAPNKTGIVVGASGLYRMADSKFGAELELGFRWDRTVFKVGVGYIPDAWALAIPKLDDMIFKAGIVHSY